MLAGTWRQALLRARSRSSGVLVALRSRRVASRVARVPPACRGVACLHARSIRAGRLSPSRPRYGSLKPGCGGPHRITQVRRSPIWHATDLGWLRRVASVSPRCPGWGAGQACCLEIVCWLVGVALFTAATHSRLDGSGSSQAERSRRPEVISPLSYRDGVTKASSLAA